MAASKKGVSAAQLGRMLGITHKSAWFMAHRIREAMKPANPSPIGGENKVVEADETFVGGKAKNRAFAKEPPKKTTVLTMIERDGEARSYRVVNVTAKTLRPIIVHIASRNSHLMTDELNSYIKIGKEFAGHTRVNHSKLEFPASVASPTSTPLSAISASSSAASMAPSIQFQRLILPAIWPNSICASTPAR